MKVRELIALLQKEDPEAVITGRDDEFNYHYEVTELKSGYLSPHGGWLTKHQAKHRKDVTKVVEVCS